MFQIDVTVIPYMEDSQLSIYLPLLGDRIAVRQFCRESQRQSTRQHSASAGSGRKHLLLQQLKEKLKRARPDDCEEASSENVTQTDHPTGTKKFRTVSVGWLITVRGRLVQVRANKGGGTRNIRVPAMATKREIVAEAQKLFFPAGVSGIGNQADFAFDLVDVQHCAVSDGVTVASLYDSTRTCGNLRFSITTTPAEVCFFNICQFLVTVSLSLV